MNWNPGLLNQLTSTKPDLDKAMKSVLESDFNVRYKCGELGKDLGEICYVPDGYAVSILIPFPMNDESCSDLGRFFDAIMNGPESPPTTEPTIAAQNSFEPNNEEKKCCKCWQECTQLLC